MAQLDFKSRAELQQGREEEAEGKRHWKDKNWSSPGESVGVSWTDGQSFHAVLPRL